MARMLQEGLEPPTLGLLDPCSTKLSYQSCAAHARDRIKDLQIFSLTLSQLSYMGVHRAIYQEISVKLSLQLKKQSSR